MQEAVIRHCLYHCHIFYMDKKAGESLVVITELVLSNDINIGHPRLVSSRTMLTDELFRLVKYRGLGIQLIVMSTY